MGKAKDPRGKVPGNLAKLNGRFQPAFVELGFNLALLGMAEREMASVFGVNLAALLLWKETHPEFKAALLAGREPAHGVVAASLYKMATGYEHIIEKQFIIDGDIVHEPCLERLPPNVSAARYWMHVHRPEKWSERVEVTGKNGGPIQNVNLNLGVSLDPVEAAKVYQKLMGADE